MGLGRFFGCGRRPSDEEDQVKEVKAEEVQKDTPKANSKKGEKEEEGQRRNAYTVEGRLPTQSGSETPADPQPAPTRLPQPKPPTQLPEGIRPLPEKRNMASWRSASATPALGTSGAPGSSTRGKPRTMFMQPANSDMIFTKSKHAQEKEADIASAILPFSKKKESNPVITEDDTSVFVQSKHERMGEELLPGMLN